MMQHIKEYTDLGLTVFPLCNQQDLDNQNIIGTKLLHKKPLNTDWATPKDIPVDVLATSISEEGRAYGVALSSDILVIDVDPRNGGEESFNKLCDELGVEIMIHCSTQVETGGGGYHYYYYKPKSLKVKKKIKGYDGLDFLTKGQFVVGVGSPHASGNVYEMSMISEPFDQMNKAPQKLLKLIKKNPVDLATQKGLDDYVETEHNIGAAIEYLQSQDPAIQGQGGDDQTYKVVVGVRDYGLPPEKALELILEHYNNQCEPPWDVEDIMEKVNNAYEYAQGALGNKTPEADFDAVSIEKTGKADNSDLLENLWGNELKINKSGGLVKNSPYNVVLFLENLEEFQGAFSFDELSNTEMLIKPLPQASKKDKKAFPKKGFEVTDKHVINIRIWLEGEYNMTATVDTINNAISYIAGQNKQHPIRNILKNLPKWDGKERVATFWVDHFGVEDNIYTREVARIFFNGAVSRVMEPGCQVDYLPIIEGKQGIGKSTALEGLSYGYHIEDIGDITNKDAIAQMMGAWMCELSEIEQYTRKETSKIKQFFTAKTDRARLAYGKRSVNYPRQTIFYGTTNKDDYFIDTTGNRRYFPMKATKISNRKEIKKQRDQLWAEAYHQYNKTGNQAYMNKEVEKMAMEQQEDRLGVDERSNDVEAYLLKEKDKIEKRGYVTGIEIWINAMDNLGSFDRYSQIVVKKIMRVLGWKSERVRPDKGIRVRAYVKEKEDI